MTDDQTRDGPAVDDQQAVIDFLSRPATWHAFGSLPTTIRRIETHGALVFIGERDVVKIKRTVKLAYLDFSTLDKRRRVCEREIAVNKAAAPDVYLGVLAITRSRDGTLALGGAGEAVEWAVHMARFDDGQLLDRIAREQGIGLQIARELADLVVRLHGAAPVHRGIDTARRLDAVVGTIVASLAAADIPGGQTFGEATRHRLSAVATLLGRRSDAGLVRRCHGDLHLGNIVLWQGAPVAFDAIEFDEDLATVDTLYDLAFLLMDLDRMGCRAAANAVLGRYLWRTGRDLDLEGLAALPLFLALRAGVRAMVGADRCRQLPADQRGHARDGVGETLATAMAFLSPAAPQLVAVGGLSGTGKSTLAAALAPQFGGAPGALHLRSDLERKALAGAGETDRLPPSAYTAEASREVYRVLIHKAGLALAAGHSVIVDAVSARSEERQALADVARQAGASFGGLWLTAPGEVMQARVTGRVNDASDATATVVTAQLGYDLGEIEWAIVDAAGEPGEVAERAANVLGLTKTAATGGNFTARSAS